MRISMAAGSRVQNRYRQMVLAGGGACAAGAASRACLEPPQAEARAKAKISKVQMYFMGGLMPYSLGAWL